MTARRHFIVSLVVALAACGGSSPAPTRQEKRVDPKADPTAGESGGEEESDGSFPLHGKIELRPLADDSEFARGLAEGKTSEGIRARLDPPPRAGGREEVVLEADDLSTLHRWVSGFKDQIPKNLRVAYEKTAPLAKPTLAEPMHKGWRLHFVQSDEGFEVKEATGRLQLAKLTARPEVRVDLTKADGERFADLSGRFVGRKLAFLHDNELLSAPVVNEKISGGALIITLAGDDEEARTLVAKLAKMPLSKVVLPKASD